MCSEFQTKTSLKQIEQALATHVVDKAKDFQWGSLVRLHTQAPVLELGEEGPQLVMKIFPASPMPNSRLSGIGNQSEGADDGETDSEHVQIKRIYEMSRWKEGFKSHPVLIPMSTFHEFAYWGQEIGTGQEFKIPGEKVLFAAGIAIKPFTPKGDKDSAFSILTHTATKQMLKYHHRLIVLLKSDHALEYLEPMDPETRFEYLIQHRYTGPLEVEKIRNMAKGWEKKTDLQNAKLHREMLYREVLQKEGVAG